MLVGVFDIVIVGVSVELVAFSVTFISDSERRQRACDSPEDEITGWPVKIQTSRTVQHPFRVCHTHDHPINGSPNLNNGLEHTLPHRFGSGEATDASE